MSTFAEASIPHIDARVEFWSGQGAKWPRNWHKHLFAGWVVHRTGRLLYGQDWNGTEPETVLIHPLPARFDTATRADELRWAIGLLVRHYPPYVAKYQAARLEGLPPPNPELDEWQFAVGLSQQISNETVAAYDRYRRVVDLLVSLLEKGILRAALRPFDLGEPQSLPPGTWYNEVYFAWFATCQVDAERPCSGTPLRWGGHWIVFEKEPFLAWELDVKSFCAERQARTAEAVEPAVTPEPPTDQSTPASATEEACVVVEKAPDTEVSASDDEKAPSETAPNTGAVEGGKPTARRDVAKRKPGAKAKFPWDSGAFQQKIVELVAGDSRPTSMNKLTELLLEWSLEHWGKEPAATTMRTKIVEVLIRRSIQFP